MPPIDWRSLTKRGASQLSSLFSVVIPLHASHLGCVSTVLTDIEAWTKQPATVVLVLSPMKFGQEALLEEVVKRHPNLSITILRRRWTRTSGRARNIGWRGCTSPFIIFLDADDAYHPRYAEVLLDAQRAYEADVVLHSLTRDPRLWEDSLREMPSAPSPVTEKDTILAHLRFYEGALARKIGPVPIGAAVSHGTGLYRREVLQALPFSGRVTGQDTIMVRRVLKSEFNLVHVDALIMYWRPGASVSLLSLRRLRRIPSRITVKISERLHYITYGRKSESALSAPFKDTARE